jgi:hypothetical protein
MMTEVGKGELWSVMVPYERFDAWKIAHRLALEVYRVAEGSAKRGPRELRRYLRHRAWLPIRSVVSAKI